MSPRERSRRGDGERLRHEIVEAGKRLLFETGDEEAVTIRAVAKAVGVSPPSIYLHFADKQALLLAVCEDTFDALDTYIEKAVADIDDIADELCARGAAYVRFGLENPEHYRILFMTRPIGLEPGAELPASDAFDHHLAAMQRAVDAGLFAEGTDVVQAAITVWAGVHGITSLLIAKPTFDWGDQEALVAAVLATLVRGLSR